MTDIGPPAEQHLRKPGWYRVERPGVWTWLAPPETRSRDLPDDPMTLVLIEDGAEEVPLW